MVRHSGSWHRITELDTEARTATCAICGPVGIRRKGRHANGTIKWVCRVAANRFKWSPGTPAGEARRRAARKVHRHYVGTSCERCGWEAEDQRLLDVHHIDGDHDNNLEENLVTLCPICHRREHLGLPPYAKGAPVPPRTEAP